MAKVKGTDIPEIAEFWSRDFWELIRNYWSPEENNEYWTSLMKDINTLATKYPYTFCSQMCIAYMNYLDLLATGKVEYDAKRTA